MGLSHSNLSGGRNRQLAPGDTPPPEAGFLFDEIVVEPETETDEEELELELQDEDLFQAAYEGNEEAVQLFLEHGLDPNFSDELGTVLHYADFSRLRGVPDETIVNIMDMLIDYGADPDVRGGDGHTIIERGLQRDQPDPVVELLLRRGAAFPFPLQGGGKKGKKQKSQKKLDDSLIKAIQDGKVKAAARALKDGANVNARGDKMGNTALILAIANNHKATVNLLLKAGASVLAVNNDDDSVLLMAVAINNNELVQRLLEAPGVREQFLNQANNVGQTPLISAAKQGNGPLVKILIDAGADVNAKDNVGNNALTYAAGINDEKMVEMLLEAGADVNAKNNSENTALLYAAKGGKATEQELTKMVDNLLDKGADVDAKNNVGYTALLYAAMNGYANMVEMLIESDADVNATNTGGSTPLLYAAKNGYTKIVQLLLEAGADVYAMVDGFTASAYAESNGYTDIVKILKDAESLTTPKRRADTMMSIDGDDTAEEEEYKADMALIGAAENGNVSLVKWILDKGADVNAMVDGYTALMLASKQGNTKIVKLLLDEGADVNAMVDGDTALRLASKQGNTKIVKLLLKAGADFNVADVELLRKAEAAAIKAAAREAAIKAAAREAAIKAAAREAAAAAQEAEAAAQEAEYAANVAAEAIRKEQEVARKAAIEAEVAAAAAAEAVRKAEEAEKVVSKERDIWERSRSRINVDDVTLVELERLEIIIRQTKKQLETEIKAAAAEAAAAAAEAARKAEEAAAAARKAEEAERARVRAERKAEETKEKRSRGDKRRADKRATIEAVQEAEAAVKRAEAAARQAAAGQRQRAIEAAQEAATLVKEELQAFDSRTRSYGNNVEKMLKAERFKRIGWNTDHHPIWRRREQNRQTGEWMTQTITIPSTPGNELRFFNNTKNSIKKSIEHLYLNKEDFENDGYIVRNDRRNVRSKWEEPGQGAL
jgi:ankyrin repeat protein